MTVSGHTDGTYWLKTLGTKNGLDPLRPPKSLRLLFSSSFIQKLSRCKGVKPFSPGSGVAAVKIDCLDILIFTTGKPILVTQTDQICWLHARFTGFRCVAEAVAGGGRSSSLHFGKMTLQYSVSLANRCYSCMCCFIFFVLAGRVVVLADPASPTAAEAGASASHALYLVGWEYNFTR